MPSEEDETVKAEALFQHGSQIALDANQKVEEDILSSDEYGPRDVIAAMFYMKGQCVAEIQQAMQDTDEEIPEAVDEAIRELALVQIDDLE